MIHCKKCGVELPAEFGEMPRLPCPECKSTVREFSMIAGSGNFKVVGGNASLIHTRPGLQSEAQRDDQGNIVLTATGPSPTNEEGVLDISARLVRMLNSNGGTWSIPVEGEQDIDAYSENSKGERLSMQVIRSTNDQALWQSLSQNGSTSRSYGDANLAGEMMDAIRKKSQRYPRRQKKDLLLVLDAARTPSHTFQPVLDAFRNQYLQDCQDAGFAQVWVVGPQDSLVARLDC